MIAETVQSMNAVPSTNALLIAGFVEARAGTCEAELL
jgi:hypothetical protein